ncbi:DUF397 domain-containing protein [Streptomyces sp. WMMC897]|uniref:DUF397 domain-containing protein n=1 Tax=unclassified Streptomyces TaxID=2593676 RepID=UPI0022B6B201|nr:MULTISPECIES: DUF397 domain-containing protein [unclassified Streptomyces]MCZ7414921.1 DUF397 domain-containing protein [Streptomyces sp. WMMC897]MCZ7431864.1 DUF397 domain-containing protein [Streptomyces sp. WMMC1477]
MTKRNIAPCELAWFKSSYSGSAGGECVEVAMSWRKSSYSTGAGGECVEVAMSWHKSSYSSGEGGECVEVAECPGTVHVRDSKRLSGPTLSMAPAAWAAFVGFASEGRR